MPLRPSVCEESFLAFPQVNALKITRLPRISCFWSTEARSNLTRMQLATFETTLTLLAGRQATDAALHPAAVPVSRFSATVGVCQVTHQPRKNGSATFR